MYKKIIKRVIDVIISLLVLIFLSPLYLLIALVIKMVDKGDIFYKQDRTGLNGKIFKIYKFRTMKDGNITKLGKFLRNTSLDELPQFLNVLKGDMAIVGPRPWIPDYYNRFNEEQKARNKVRPGLVGLAQVNGRKELDIIDKINYDLKYIQSVNILQDIKILLKSIKIIIKRENINVGKNYIENELQKLENFNKNIKKAIYKKC